jgi:hypothetical protein
MLRATEEEIPRGRSFAIRSRTLAYARRSDTCHFTLANVMLRHHGDCGGRNCREPMHTQATPGAAVTRPACRNGLIAAGAASGVPAHD